VELQNFYARVRYAVQNSGMESHFEEFLQGVVLQTHNEARALYMTHHFLSAFILLTDLLKSQT
jgi:hypothetical protein